MRLSCDGLTLWYGTNDAPAPSGIISSRQNISIRIGVHPLHPNNKVVIRYRIAQEGLVQSLAGVLTQSDYATSTQYFAAEFPILPMGQTIEYLVQLFCSGRQVPNVLMAQQFPSSFVVDPSLSLPSQLKKDINPSVADNPDRKVKLHCSSIALNYLGTVNLHLIQSPELIGETPEGLKVNWSLKGGTVVGPKLNAVIRPSGGDWMTIRPDGIGLVDARATLETNEGNLIQTTYSGVFDLGDAGYRDFLQRKWPHAPPLKVTPRFLCKHSRYQWLNRLQCIGIGEVQMADLLVIYDLYAL